MTLVKSPSFNELVRTYGSPKKAVQHLLKSGYSPDRVSWKMGLPYYLVRLYIAGIESTKQTAFSSLTAVYDRLASLTSKKGKETEIVKFLGRTDLELEEKVRLLAGNIVDESLRIGPGVIERALTIATGTGEKQVKRLLFDYGEYGEVAFQTLKAKKPTLTLEEVYQSIRILPTLSKVKERDYLIASLLDASTPQEGKYIVRLLLSDLRLGYHQRTVVQAAAKSYKVPKALIENVCAILGLTKGIMLASKGVLALANVRVRPGQFFEPQLAKLYQPDRVVYPALAEHKLDGSRLQAHRWGTRIWLYSRRGIEKKALPEVVEIARGFHAQSCIVDGEVVAIDQNRRILPFQDLLERTVPRDLSSSELARRRARVGITFRAFDLTFLNGRELFDSPLSERRRFLREVVPSEYLVVGRECKDEVELMRFYEESLKERYEGLVVKDLSAPYAIGQRTNSWLKLKPERDTVDCTFVKALYGKGKLAGLFSSFLMAVRDSARKRLFTIGRVSNLPREVMEELWSIVQKTGTDRDKEGILIRPSIVAEVTYEEVQTTNEYTSGFALRVPKVVRFRPDKTIDEIDTVEKMQTLYELQYDR